MSRVATFALGFILLVVAIVMGIKGDITNLLLALIAYLILCGITEDD